MMTQHRDVESILDMLHSCSRQSMQSYFGICIKKLDCDRELESLVCRSARKVALRLSDLYVIGGPTMHNYDDHTKRAPVHDSPVTR